MQRATRRTMGASASAATLWCAIDDAFPFAHYQPGNREKGLRVAFAGVQRESPRMALIFSSGRVSQSRCRDTVPRRLQR